MSTDLTKHNKLDGSYASLPRMSKSNTRYSYQLKIIQQPKIARACGQGQKSTTDRRPVDPPPVVELRIFEGEEPNRREISQEYPANFFVNASLEWSETPRGENTRGSRDNTKLLTGTPNTGGLYLDRPRKAVYFIFGDLSVRYEGFFKLKFQLYETSFCNHATSMNVIQDLHSDDQADFAINRMQVTSQQFEVFSAKKFPGLETSTHLSRELADQGCKVRIRRDIRTRKHDEKDGMKEGYEAGDDEGDESDAERYPETPVSAYPRSDSTADRKTSAATACTAYTPTQHVPGPPLIQQQYLQSHSYQQQLQPEVQHLQQPQYAPQPHHYQNPPQYAPTSSQMPPPYQQQHVPAPPPTQPQYTQHSSQMPPPAQPAVEHPPPSQQLYTPTYAHHSDTAYGSYTASPAAYGSTGYSPQQPDPSYAPLTSQEAPQAVPYHQHNQQYQPVPFQVQEPRHLQQYQTQYDQPQQPRQRQQSLRIIENDPLAHCIPGYWQQQPPPPLKYASQESMDKYELRHDTDAVRRPDGYLMPVAPQTANTIKHFIPPPPPAKYSSGGGPSKRSYGETFDTTHMYKPLIDGQRPDVPDHDDDDDEAPEDLSAMIITRASGRVQTVGQLLARRARESAAC